MSTVPTVLEASVELVSGAATGIAAVLSIRTARRAAGAQRRGWASLGVGFGLWALSNVVVDVPVLIGFVGRGSDAQILQGLAIVSVVVGLWVLPVAEWAPGARLRTGLDALVTSVCVIVILVQLLLPRVLAQSGTASDHVFAMLYPLASLSLAASAYVLGRGHGGYRRPDLSLLVAGFGWWLLAGVGSALLATGRTVAPVQVSVCFGLGAALIAWAAHLAMRPDPTLATTTPRSVRAIDAVPEVVVIATVVVMVTHSPDVWYDWMAVAAASVAVLVRQLVVRADARRSRDSLEAEVLARTVELEKVSARHSRILAAVGEGIVGVDAEGWITFANVAAGRLLGYEPDELVGQGVCETLCGTRHEECPLHLVGTLGHVITDEQSGYRHKDGSLVPVEVTAGPKEAPGVNGRAGIVVAFRDVSERQAMEQMKQQFISSVSHELRTPLTSIRGVLEMLSDGDAGEMPALAEGLIATAQRGSERLSRLVNDIIDMEKLAAGDFSVVPRPTDLPLLIGDAISSLEGLAASTGVRIRVGELDGTALCDPDRVVQALVNLIGNAVKFSPDDGTVLVRAVAQETQVVVSVRDDGRGIPADQLDHVFDRFHQVRATDATEKGGTGLGLTITRSIVERHGGQIWVESVYGEGTTFSFSLPLAPVTVETAPRLAAGSQA